MRHKGKRPEDHIGARLQTQGAGPGVATEGRHREASLDSTLEVTGRGVKVGEHRRDKPEAARLLSGWPPRAARTGSSESKFLRDFTGGHSRLISAA